MYPQSICVPSVGMLKMDKYELDEASVESGQKL